MDKLLIIGASGLLGSTAAELAAQDYEVHATYSSHIIKGFTHLDVTDSAAVANIFKKIKPDFVLDAHAMNDVELCEANQEDAWLINVEGTKNVANASKSAGAKYVYLSTDYVFDGTKTTAYTEEDNTNPINYYGKTKLTAEKLIEESGADYIIGRTAVLFGTGIFEKVPFPLWVIEQLKSNKQVNLVDDQYNNPTLVDNLIDFLFTLMKKGENGIFHTTGKDSLSRYQFGLEIAKEFSLDKSLISPITSKELNQAAKRPKRLSMDISKVEKATRIQGLPIKKALRILRSRL